MMGLQSRELLPVTPNQTQLTVRGNQTIADFFRPLLFVTSNQPATCARANFLLHVTYSDCFI